MALHLPSFPFLCPSMSDKLLQSFHFFATQLDKNKEMCETELTVCLPGFCQLNLACLNLSDPPDAVRSGFHCNDSSLICGDSSRLDNALRTRIRAECLKKKKTALNTDCPLTVFLLNSPTACKCTAVIFSDSCINTALMARDQEPLSCSRCP